MEKQAVDKPVLTGSDINFYALANGTLTMSFSVTTTYLTIFCTDYLGISPLAYGNGMLIAKLFDFVVCLLAGPIIEKSNMKHGKYMSWIRLLTGTLFFGNIIQLFPTHSFGNPMLSLIIVCIGYCMFHGSMNFNATVRGAIIVKLAGGNMDNRRRLTQRQTQIGAAVSIISSAITLPCVQFAERYIGEGNGYFLVALVFSTAYLLCNIIFIKKCSKFDPPVTNAAARKTATIKEIIESITTNRQMIILVCIYTFFSIGSQIYAGLIGYYFRVITGKFEMITVAYTIRSFVALGASFIIPTIGKKIGKRWALPLGHSIFMLSLVGMWLFGLKSMIAQIVFMCTAMCGTYFYMSFGANYWLDCGEYGYNKTGKDLRGIATAVMNIPTKIGFAIGGSMVGYSLAWIGYESGMEVTAKFAADYMRVLALVPACFMIVAILLGIFAYKLSDEEAARYARENVEREAKELVD